MSSLRKEMKSQPSEMLAAKGLLYHDWYALSDCQRECTARLGMTIQMEQGEYLLRHPELTALLKLFISEKSMNSLKKKTDILKEAAQYFLRPPDELERNIRKHLNLKEDEPYLGNKKPLYHHTDKYLTEDLRKIIEAHQVQEEWNPPSSGSVTADTMSSSFISLVTSDTTLPTPEPVPTPEPTLSETFFNLVSNTIDKAVYSKVDDRALLYDIAYVELKNAVETAMEIPVEDIKEDLHELFFNALNTFEINIAEKERIAAEIAWDKRMRKKMKRTLRRAENFKGYATPESPKSSETSSHESYRKPPHKPCVCHPQWHYNRYKKDRFGIYLPFETEFQSISITVSPAVSYEDLPQTDEALKKPGTYFSCSKGSQKLTAKSSTAGFKPNKRA